MEDIQKKRRLSKGLKETEYISKITDFIRDSLFKLIKHFIFEIDGFTCNLCLNHGGNLVVHHIIPLKTIDSYREKNKFKLVYDLENLITLCHTCHVEKVHNNNYLDVNYDLQEELQEITKTRYISKECRNKYNKIVLDIEKK